MPDLYVLSNIVNFVGVALALWLGFFNLTRSPARTLTRVAALTLWAGGGYLLSNLMYYNRLPEGSNYYWAALFRWSTFLGPPLWMHLSATLLPRPLYARRQPLLIGLYLIALLWIALDTYSPVLLKSWNSASPVRGDSRTPHEAFPLFILYLLICVGVTALNLWQARRHARRQPALRRHVAQFIAASVLTGLGVLYLTAIVQFSLAAPNVIGDLSLTSGLALMGYAVAQVAALYDGRSVQRDFVYTLLAISLICGAYLFATLLSYLIYGIPFVTFIFVLMLAVITHSAYDWARSTLDRFFFREPTRELRANLRTLAHEAGGDQGVDENLRTLLTTLCQSVSATRGLLLTRDGEQFSAQATYRMSAPAQPLPLSALSADELTPLHGPSLLGDMALLAPLRLVDEQAGALVLGPREHGAAYSTEDEDLILDVADRIENLLAQVRLRAERTQQLNAQLAEFRAGERELQTQIAEPLAPAEVSAQVAGLSDTEFTRAVEDALRHLTDITYLSEHALSQLQVVARRLPSADTTHLERGRALKEMLLEALGQLRPADAPEPKQPSSEWFPFLILREAYVLGVPNREIMARLYISEGTFNRTRRRAIRAVAKAMAELERASA